MHPCIQIPSTSEIRRREAEWKVIRIAEQLTKKMHKMCWHEENGVWYTTLEAGEQTYGFKIDQVLVPNGLEDTPHKIRLQGYAFDRWAPGGWWEMPFPPSDFDLVGHPILRELMTAVRVKDLAVSRLIDSMIAELNSLEAPA